MEELLLSHNVISPLQWAFVFLDAIRCNTVVAWKCGIVTTSVYYARWVRQDGRWFDWTVSNSGICINREASIRKAYGIAHSSCIIVCRVAGKLASDSTGTPFIVPTFFITIVIFMLISHIYFFVYFFMNSNKERSYAFSNDRFVRLGFQVGFELRLLV